jgi:excisionase family DNA binding protein
MAALLGVREAANVLGVHENTLRRWAEKGYLKPVVNPSGVRRFRLDEIQRLRSRMYDGGGFATPRQSEDVVTVGHVEPVD